MSETYKMELTENQVKWLLNKENTNFLLKDKDKFIQHIEKQNCAMHLVIEEVLKFTNFKNHNHENIAGLQDKTIDYFLIYDDWYDKNEVINHLRGFFNK